MKKDIQSILSGAEDGLDQVYSALEDLSDIITDLEDAVELNKRAKNVLFKLYERNPGTVPVSMAAEYSLAELISLFEDMFANE